MRPPHKIHNDNDKTPHFLQPDNVHNDYMSPRMFQGRFYDGQTQRQDHNGHIVFSSDLLCILRNFQLSFLFPHNIEHMRIKF